MATRPDSPFDITTFLASAGLGRHLVHLSNKQVFLAQGAQADSVFFLQTGRAKLTVVSERGPVQCYTCNKRLYMRLSLVQDQHWRAVQRCLARAELEAAS
jgi:CRP-like cAMP-binding protein